MATILLDRKADPPFIAARNRRADQYLPAVQRGMKALFDKMVERTAYRAELEMNPAYDAEMEYDLALQIKQFLTPFILTMVTDGYVLANSEVSTKSIDDKAWTKLYEEVPEPITGRRGNIEEWLTETANREAKTHAKEIRNIHEKARTYWDEEVGQGLTPREVAKEILTQGYVYDKNYANLISRTNTMWAMNEGAEIRYLEAGVTREKWLTTDDDVRCVYCMDMDGTEIGITDVFLPEGGRIQHPEIPERFLEVPFAVAHPPLHPFCRCSVIPVIESIQVPIGV